MTLAYLSHKVRIDMNLGGLSRSGSPLGCDHGPGGVDLVNLEVQLVKLVVSEHVISVSPSSSQLIEQSTDLSSLHFRTSQGLK